MCDVPPADFDLPRREETIDSLPDEPDAEQYRDHINSVLDLIQKELNARDDIAAVKPCADRSGRVTGGSAISTPDAADSETRTRRTVEE